MNSTNTDDIMKKIRSVQHWYHRIPITADISTPGHVDAAITLMHLEAPESCKGLRVLDLGTRDGGFAFELEKRGAEVLAIDYMRADQTGFKVTAELLNSKVTFIQENIYQVTKEKYGTFDIVLFLGLLYHLPDPMHALYIVRSVCRDQLYVESQVIDEAFLMPNGTLVSLKSISPKLGDLPIMQFYPGNSLNRDYTNYWAPNMKCLEMMLIENDFAVITKKMPNPDHRGLFKCKISGNAFDYHNKIARGMQSPS